MFYTVETYLLNTFIHTMATSDLRVHRNTALQTRGEQAGHGGSLWYYRWGKKKNQEEESLVLQISISKKES